MDRGLSKKCQIHLRNSLSSKRSRNTLQKVGTFLKKGLTALHYLEQKRYGRKKAELAEEDQALMQEDLDKIGAWRSSKLGFLLLFLAPCVFFTIWEIFSKEEFPCKGKRKTNGHTEKGGKEAFCRSLEEREETCPDFKDEFGHWEGDTIVGKKSQVQL